ncbi:hypothetical protein [Actinoplanes xinjiangensis]|uniref:hypothetical protein n=1 Tax=Actinoplanes xinjiangensis TaxID=512350 RepID=UPI003438FB8A
MATYVIDVHEVTHTCPSFDEPHAIDTRRRVVEVIPSGPCLAPRRVRCGSAVLKIPCSRRVPSDRQCENCRTDIVIRHHTTHYVGDVLTEGDQRK